MPTTAQGNPGQVYKTTQTINQGETLALAIQLFEYRGGPPIKLAGYTVEGTIEFPEPLGPQSFTTGNGGFTITNAAEGQIVWNITSAASADYPPGNDYPFDIWLTTPGGGNFPIMQGPFVVLASVTILD